MEDRGDAGRPRSDSKLAGEKRTGGELKEKPEVARKKIKMRELESLLGSEEASSSRLKNKEDSDHFQLSEQMSQVTSVPVTLDLDAYQVERRGRTTLSVEFTAASRPLDLNSEACIANNLVRNDIAEHADNCNEVPLLKKHEDKHGNKCVTSVGIGLDLNAEDDSSVSQELFRTNKDQDKSRDVSECGSTTGPVQEKDPLRMWKEVKQNGFLSSSHGGISIQSGFMSSSHGGIPMPKQCGRKPEDDVHKKKMELAKREQVDRLAKREQVDRLAKIAAPSGLLNGLNPGIINHVRNKKQVHSIIEALVRSEKLENGCLESKQAIHLKSGTKETNNMSDSGIQRLGFSHGDGSLTSLIGSKQTSGCSMSNGQGDFNVVGTVHARNFVSYSGVSKDYVLALKLSSSTSALEESRTVLNEESANSTNVCCLSVRAASVSSQWLELLHQDIKGRIAALRRSRKRVRAVITTELHFLISKEFSAIEVDSSYIMQSSSEVVSNNTTAALHQARWRPLFDQLDKALYEEEKQLERWLCQVKEMQVHFDQGLQHLSYKAILGYPRTEKADSLQKELAVRAAAASIYSTCNFLTSKENVSCF
ncbi:uncharacterized protein LOC133669429 [Populus nigra]|uniref:uncharacterized protein LOC133669429 n=1 Tax=Populus nigra TaxID=3691 RepID=UPI002B267185|nr:uncharacterized protein LOC133669429 [Populus nigra]